MAADTPFSSLHTASEMSSVSCTAAIQLPDLHPKWALPLTVCVAVRWLSTPAQIRQDCAQVSVHVRVAIWWLVHAPAAVFCTAAI
jgi:hypothetical protein